MRTRVLLVNEEPAVFAALQRSATGDGRDIETAADAASAIARLSRNDVDICVTDLQLPAGDGLQVIEAARRLTPPVPVIVLTGSGGVRDAIAALRLGAADFLSKPFHVEALNESFLRVTEEASAGGPAPPPHPAAPIAEPRGAPRPHRSQRAALIGEHPAMRRVLERIDQIADTGANVLIRGETGTGKEVVARLVHTSSQRRAAPFVAMNMAAIPEALAETELFGHEKGAFTDAGRSQSGKFRAAQGGTLFLDEIGDMPKGLQSKLLRTLEERVVHPVGGGEGVPIDVRLVAATHRNLEQLVADGDFREDLYYRLDVLPIELPPLRERRSDIPALAEHFRDELNAENGRSVPGFTPEVLLRLSTFDWPGNVRQLENTIERLVLTAGNRMIAIDDLPPALRGDVVDVSAGSLDLPESGVDLRMLLSQLEERFIDQALLRTGGNKNRAAELLGMNRTTLVEKLRRRNVA
jgi:DNA-binding NtrC family response regulator